MLTRRRVKKYGKKILIFLRWANLNLPKNKEDPITLNPIGAMCYAPHVWIVEGPSISFVFEASSLAEHVETCGAFNPITRKPLCKMELYRIQRLLGRPLSPKQLPVSEIEINTTSEIELALQTIISEALASINDPEIVPADVFDAYISIIEIIGVVLGDSSPETVDRIVTNSYSRTPLNPLDQIAFYSRPETQTIRNIRARQLSFTLRQLSFTLRQFIL